MKKSKINILKTFIIFIIVSILFLIPTNVYAYYVEVATGTSSTTSTATESGVIDPGDFKPPALTDDETQVITSKASIITNIIGIIGIIVSVISLILIGIKFMTGSVEEKAEYKKSMIPYLIGVFIFFALTQFLNIIMKIVEEFNV